MNAPLYNLFMQKMRCQSSLDILLLLPCKTDKAGCYVIDISRLSIYSIHFTNIILSID